jgi:hypothetical protein
MTASDPSLSAEPAIAGIFADPRFREQELADLLAALHLRATTHPDNPGLIACWPAVPEDRMPAACRELSRRGHAVHSASVAGCAPGSRHAGWAVDRDRCPTASTD